MSCDVEIVKFGEVLFGMDTPSINHSNVIPSIEIGETETEKGGEAETEKGVEAETEKG